MCQLFQRIHFRSQQNTESGKIYRRDEEKAGDAHAKCGILEAKKLKIKEKGGEGMNIDKTTGSSFIQSYQKQMQVSKVEKAKPLQQEDHLQISNQAKQMFEGKNDIDLDRLEKIKALKSQVQAGEYQVSNEKVADKIFQFWYGQ